LILVLKSGAVLAPWLLACSSQHAW
jgi:hypothetical protein